MVVDSVVTGGKILLHCDLDAFFAAVETLHHNLDSNEPIVIGSNPKSGKGRGIVSTCNYAARDYGIHSAMPISEAWRRCPGKPVGPAIYMQSTRGLYRRASKKVMDLLKSEADKFEQSSIDEAYMDITERVGGDWDVALSLANELQKRIMDSVNLSASFGIGPTRILAKMAGEENKPMGVFRILPGDILTKVDRAAMGVSLETRIPFLNHKVVELAWNMPIEMKIHGGESKWALRRILEDYVPKNLVNRPKMGFGVPIGRVVYGLIPNNGWTTR